jgi:hypothetical protein
MTYKIKQSSPFLYVVTLLTVIFSGTAILLFLSSNHVLPKEQPLIFILCFAPIIGFAFYLPRFTATAEIEITIDDEGLKRKWLRQFIWHSKPDNEFKWAEIDDYAFQPDRQFDQFKLHFKDGTKFKFYHNNDHDSKDDFRKFLLDFVHKVEQLNNADNNKRNDIKLGKTIYETTLGLLLAIVAVIMIVGLPIMIFVLPHKGTLKSSNYAMLGASYIGAIYFIVQVYTHRKRRKEYEDSFK